MKVLTKTKRAEILDIADTEIVGGQAFIKHYESRLWNCFWCYNNFKEGAKVTLAYIRTKRGPHGHWERWVSLCERCVGKIEET